MKTTRAVIVYHCVFADQSGIRFKGIAAVAADLWRQWKEKGIPTGARITDFEFLKLRPRLVFVNGKWKPETVRRVLDIPD